MIGLFKYDSCFDEYFRMPAEMLPPTTLYRFKPDRKEENRTLVEDCVFAGGQRVMFEGGLQYTKFEIEKLQDFFAYLKKIKAAQDRR